MSDRLKIFLVISVIAHLVGALIIHLNPDFGRFFPKKPTKVTWVKLAKGTGEDPSPHPFKKAKGMPESTLREQKDALKEIAKDKKGTDQKSVESPIKPKTKTPEPPPANKKTSPDGAIDFTKKKPAKETKIDDALARIEQQLQKRQVEIEAAQVKNEGTGQSPDGSLDSSGEVDAVIAAYVGQIIRKVQSQWITTPKALAEGQVLKVQITVTIDSQGKLIQAAYETRSGDASFDLSAMRAVERSSPFPPPPDPIKDEAVGEGFLIEFNPRSVVSGN